jgi:hypothetical protein
VVQKDPGFCAEKKTLAFRTSESFSFKAFLQFYFLSAPFSESLLLIRYITERKSRPRIKKKEREKTPLEEAQVFCEEISKWM